MRAYPEILVIRHGETTWNRERRMQGRLDSPLTSLGRAQARAVGGWLADQDCGTHAVFTSPQGRARRTADLALASLGLSATPDPRLAEIDVGDWSGLTMAEIQATGADLLPGETFADFCFRALGGEGLEALWSRGRAVLDDLNGPAILFTHGILSGALRAIAMGRGPEAMADLPGGQGVIHVVRDGTHHSFSPAVTDP